MKVSRPSAGELSSLKNTSTKDGLPIWDGIVSFAIHCLDVLKTRSGMFAGIVKVSIFAGCPTTLSCPRLRVAFAITVGKPEKP